MHPHRRNEMQRLAALMDGDGPPLVITGSRGAGKSSLCDGLVSFFERDASRAVVHMHVGDIGNPGHDEDLVFHLEASAAHHLKRIGAKYRCIPSRSDREGPGLPCFDVEAGKIVVVLDGIDHLLSTKGLNASFFPRNIPRSMRLAVAVSHGPIVEALAARGWHVHEVEPLAREEIEELARERLSGNVPKLVEALLDWPPGNHPTHLLLACSLTNRAGVAPSPTDDVAAVAARLLEHMAPRPEDAALLLVCKYGITDTWSSRRPLTVRLRELEPAVVVRRNAFEPATPEVRQALRARVTEAQLREAQPQVFELYHADRSPPLVRAAADCLLELGDHARLADYVTQLAPFQILINSDGPFVARCWRAAGGDDLAARCDRMLETLLPGHQIETRIALINNAGVLAGYLGLADKARELGRRALAEASAAFPPTHAKIGIALQNLAVELAKTSENEAEVDALYHQMLATHDGPVPVAEGYPSKWLVHDRLATRLENRVRYDEALVHREAGIAAARRALGQQHPVVAAQLLEASKNIRLRQPEQALRFAEEAHAILQATLGPRNSEVLRALRSVAHAELELGHAERALATSRRAEELGREVTATEPMECAYALDQLVDIADAMDDRRTAMARREAHHQYLLSALGPDHWSTLSAANTLALAYEADGQLDRALGLVEDRGTRQKAKNGPTSWDALESAVAAARLCWLLGQRSEAERRLTETEGLFDAKTHIVHRALAMLLRSEWGREDGQPDVQREWLEKAVQLYREQGTMNASAGMYHALLGGVLHLRGDQEPSAHHHEVGLALLNDGQRHLQPLILRPYLSDQHGAEAVAKSRLRELRVALALNSSRPGIGREVLAARPLRVAWNPCNGHTLAVLDQDGSSHLFSWHAEAAHLERLDAPFPKIALPKDQTSFTLRWSSSGQALRLTTADTQQQTGQLAAGEDWTPASPLTPDGRFFAYLGKYTVYLMLAPGIGN